EPDGPLLAVLALIEQTRGGAGSYGTTSDAEERLPELPETQGLDSAREEQATGSEDAAAQPSDGGGEGRAARSPRSCDGATSPDARCASPSERSSCAAPAPRRPGADGSPKPRSAPVAVRPASSTTSWSRICAGPDARSPRACAATWARCARDGSPQAPPRRSASPWQRWQGRSPHRRRGEERWCWPTPR